MYRKKAHVHFVGIGGIGMSGIATILQHQGYEVSGCDADHDQHSVKNLIRLGCKVYQGNNTPFCADESIEVLVYSSAIKADNSEIVAAQKRGIPTIPRALMLAELMRTKYSIAIAGSHGKTTTTSLISHILLEAHLDPTIIIGGHLQTLSTNAHFGTGDFLVAEADESDRTLTRLIPTLAVITNIDLEHLETYKDLDDIKHTFAQFLNNLPFYGKAIVCVDDANVRSLLPMPHIKTIKYGLDASHADLYADSIELLPNHSTFSVKEKKSLAPLGTVHFMMPGRHNILNALAAIAIALDLGIAFETIATALGTFKGIDRRFSYKGTYQGAEIFDDYGHHPQEILNTLLVAKKRAHKKLIVVFQPHRYSRTSKLWHEFVTVLSNPIIDRLIITDIYSANEVPIKGVTGENLALAITACNSTTSVCYAPYDSDFEKIIPVLAKESSEGDLILLLGAGKINKIAPLLTTKDSTPLPTSNNKNLFTHPEL